ncbi:MAG: FAD-dependent oxidoreductase [Desulfomonilaceae bacterium]
MCEQDESRVVILGGGIAGLAIAKLLSENEIPFAIVEKSDRLGGHTRDWACMATDKCSNCYSCSVFDLEDAVVSSGKGQILLRHELSSVITSNSGITGVKLRDFDNDNEKELFASAIVIAVGFEPFDPVGKAFWGYGLIDGVITLAELNHLIRLDDWDKLLPDRGGCANLAFFQCVGSRDKSIGSNYCSQYCCAAAIRAALRILYERPEWKISIFYIDLQIAGKTIPDLIEEARKKGVRFLQGVPGEIRLFQEGGLQVILEKEGKNVAEVFDRIVLSIGQHPSPSASIISRITEAPLNEFGFFQTRSSFDPVRSPVDRIYIAGACSGPANIPDVILNAGQVVSAIIADIEQTI